LSDDIVLEQAAGHPYPGLFTGKAEVVPALGEILSMMGMRSVDVKTLLADGPVAVAIIDVECTDKAAQPFTMSAAETWRVVDHRITEIKPYYFDTATLSARVK
jgi:ketosteroid isomerase-like protein